MMISFKQENNKLILSYSSDQPSPEWVYHEIEKSGKVSIGKAFSFTKNELKTTFDRENEFDPVEFEVATKEEEYYRFHRNLMSLECDLFIHESVDFERKFFVAERGISIFPKIDDILRRPWCALSTNSQNYQRSCGRIEFAEPAGQQD